MTRPVTLLEEAVNRAFGLEVNVLRLQALRAKSTMTQTYDLYQISMKALEFMAGQGGHDEFTKQLDEPEYDPWEMRRAIVELAPKWGGSVLGEILILSVPMPRRTT